MFFPGAAKAVLADSAASDAATASRVRNLVIDLSLAEGWMARIERWLGPAGLWAAASARSWRFRRAFVFFCGQRAFDTAPGRVHRAGMTAQPSLALTLDRSAKASLVEQIR